MIPKDELDNLDLTSLDRKVGRRVKIFADILAAKESWRRKHSTHYRFVNDEDIPELNAQLRIKGACNYDHLHNYDVGEGETKIEIDKTC